MAVGRTRDGRLVREYVPGTRSATDRGRADKRIRRAYTPSRAKLYRVWAHITTHPQHGIDRIAKATHISHTSVGAVLNELERRGVFVQEYSARRRSSGARRIIEPFSWIEE